MSDGLLRPYIWLPSTNTKTEIGPGISGGCKQEKNRNRKQQLTETKTQTQKKHKKKQLTETKTQTQKQTETKKRAMF